MSRRSHAQAACMQARDGRVARQVVPSHLPHAALAEQVGVVLKRQLQGTAVVHHAQRQVQARPTRTHLAQGTGWHQQGDGHTGTCFWCH